MYNTINTQWVAETLSGMTTEEKVGQLLMVSFFNMGHEALPKIMEKINQYHLGGYFQGMIQGDVQATCVENIQKQAKVPLLVSADFEIGTGWTITDGTRFPRPMARACASDLEAEYEIGKITAQQGRSTGNSITFSPLLDLNIEPLCPDVNVRAYSDDLDTVCTTAVPFIKGLQAHGMLSTVKHFPGNGGTMMDQHICTAILPQTKEEMDTLFLEAYRRVFKEADPAAVMVAHLEVPALVTEINPKTGRLVPTSMSSEVVTDLLRNELGYKGLIITDALNMGGVTSQYTREEAAVKTVQAGVDMLLIFNAEDMEREYHAILDAVKSGDISMNRLDDAVRNVLNAKSKVGMDQDRGMPYPEEKRAAFFGEDIGKKVCEGIAEKAVTVLRNRNNLLPIKDIAGKKVTVLNTFNPDASTMKKQGQAPTEEILMEELQKRGAIVEAYEVSDDISFGEMRGILSKALENELIFLNFFVVPSWGIGTMIPNKNVMRLFMSGLLTKAKNIVITTFGDPYIMHYCPAAPVYVCTYDETLAAQKAAVAAWLGEVPITGKSPVSLKGMYQKGDGICL